MSSFDTTLHALGLSLAVPGPDEVDPEAPMLQLVVTVGMILPLQITPGQPVIAPTATYRIPIPRALALDLGPKLAEAAEGLPEPVAKPDLVIPGNVDGQGLE